MNNLMRTVPTLLAAVLLLSSLPISAQTPVDLRLDYGQGYTRMLEPGEAGFFPFTVFNDGTTAATDVVVTVMLPTGGSATAQFIGLIGGTCTPSGTTLTCTVASLPAHESLTIVLTLTAPSRNDGQNMHLEVDVTSAQPDPQPNNHISVQIPMFRLYYVTNTADEGLGSLRSAIESVNGCAHYVPCAIAFNIPGPVPEQGWFTIQPRTPLPEIFGGTLRMDGRKQTEFTGDTNPDGPEIEISGALASGPFAGLRVQPNCHAIIRDLAVNGFSGYGIALVRRPEIVNEHCIAGGNGGATLTANYLGTDPRGRVAKPNMRGLQVLADEVFVYENVISGNRRSGIYIEGGVYHDVRYNRIGIGADGSRLGNGAGIFLDLDGGVDIRDNIVAYNDGMAIARTRRGEIHVTTNSIFDNLQQGIDVDVDGPTPQRANDTDVPNAPVLFSATYDPVNNKTIVRGRLESEHAMNFRVLDVYASTRNSAWSTPQAEQFLSMHHINSGQPDFELTVPGDFRGKWITATYNAVRALGFARPRGGIATQNHRLGLPADTSELSNSVFAQ